MKKAIVSILFMVLLLANTGCFQTVGRVWDWYQNRPPAEQPEPERPTDIQAEWRLAPWDRDVTAWDKTITLYAASISYVGGHDPWEVYVEYDRLQLLPAWFQHPDPNNLNQHNVNGSIWLIREFRGDTIIGTIDYLRVGQQTKRFALRDEWLIDPEPGDWIGVMVSTTARQWDGTRVDGDPRSPYRQRSNITWTEWPL